MHPALIHSAQQIDTHATAIPQMYGGMALTNVTETIENDTNPDYALLGQYRSYHAEPGAMHKYRKLMEHTTGAYRDFYLFTTNISTRAEAKRAIAQFVAREAQCFPFEPHHIYPEVTKLMRSAFESFHGCAITNHTIDRVRAAIQAVAEPGPFTESEVRTAMARAGHAE